MPGAPVADDIAILVLDDRKGRGDDPPSGGSDGGGGQKSGGGSEAISSRRYFTGLALGIVAILMFFMALVSAYLVRKGTGTDWIPMALPSILLVNTGILLASSLTLELARRRLGLGDRPGFQTYWLVTTGLGLLFLAGQLLAWRQLVAAGAYLSSNPSSSFFYTFTAAHGLHLLGGIVALIVIAARSFDHARVTRSTAAELTSIYWHFMDGLWVFLLALLYLGR